MVSHSWGWGWGMAGDPPSNNLFRNPLPSKLMPPHGAPPPLKNKAPPI